MIKKGVIILVFLLAFSFSVHAAILHGSVYDGKLQPRNDVVIEVNSSPSQVFVSKEGQYSFVLDPGHYSVNAHIEYNGVKYFTRDNVSIPRNGYFVRDLFLESDAGVALPEEEEEGNFNFVYVISLAILISVILYLFIIRKKKPKEIKYEVKYEEPNEEDKEETKEVVKEEVKKEVKVSEVEDKFLNQVMDIIKKEDGRTTQKEIRKQLPLSEAKVSLIITELEEKGVVKKIKKGRGNVIILNK